VFIEAVAITCPPWPVASDLYLSLPGQSRVYTLFSSAEPATDCVEGGVQSGDLLRIQFEVSADLAGLQQKEAGVKTPVKGSG
jgi:hypothetical protein